MKFSISLLLVPHYYFSTYLIGLFFLLDNTNYLAQVKNTATQKRHREVIYPRILLLITKG